MRIVSITALRPLPAPGHLGLDRETISAADVGGLQRVPEGIIYKLGGRRLLVPQSSIRYAEVADEHLCDWRESDVCACGAPRPPSEVAMSVSDELRDALEAFEEAEAKPQAPKRKRPKRKPKKAA